jgi:hypothetical protein
MYGALELSADEKMPESSSKLKQISVTAAVGFILIISLAVTNNFWRNSKMNLDRN